jgi:hypothetical protein
MKQLYSSPTRAMLFLLISCEVNPFFTGVQVLLGFTMCPALVICLFSLVCSRLCASGGHGDVGVEDYRRQTRSQQRAGTWNWYLFGWMVMF